MLIHVVQRTVLYRSGSLISRFDGIVASVFVGVCAPFLGVDGSLVSWSWIVDVQKLAFPDETLAPKTSAVEEVHTEGGRNAGLWRESRIARIHLQHVLTKKTSRQVLP